MAERSKTKRAPCYPAGPRRAASLVFPLIGALAIASTSCKQDNPQTSPETREPVRIALVGESRDEPTWPVLQATAAWFMSRYRLAQVETSAPMMISPGEQQKLLAELENAPFDSVCVVASDPDAVLTSIQDLVRHGKKVVTIGRDVPNSNRNAYYGPSESDIGRVAAQACATVLKGRPPTIMLLHAGLENDAYAARYYAFKNELPLLGELQLLREIDCAGKEFDAAHLVRVDARRYPRAGCWVFLDDWPLRTIPESERLLPLGGGIVLCEGSPRYWDRLRNGQILAMITYDFRRAVEEALLTASRRSTREKDVHDTWDTMPTEIVTVRELETHERRWRLWERSDQSAESAYKQTTPAPDERIPQPPEVPVPTNP